MTNLTRLVALVAISITALPVAAETDVNHFTISFISDGAQGRNLSHANYEAAIKRLEHARAGGINGFYATNNLCVAYLKTGAFSKAEDTCTKAVDHISSIRKNERRSSYGAFMGSSYSDMKAIALSNRGVLHALNDELDLAADAFNAALQIESNVQQPEINLARLIEIAEPQS